MRAFTEQLTERSRERITEGSLWDQGAWNREHGTGNVSHPSAYVTGPRGDAPTMDGLLRSRFGGGQ